LRGGSGGLAICLTATGPLGGSLTSLRDDGKVYVDLPGLVLDQETSQYLGVAGVLRLRAVKYQEQPPVARFVLDLYDDEATVRWVPEGDEGVLLIGAPADNAPVFVPELPHLESADLQSVPGQSSEAVLKFSGPVDFSWDVSANPWQATVTVPDASGPTVTRESEGDAPIRSLRIGPAPGGGICAQAALGWLLRMSVTRDAEAREIHLTMRREPLAGKRIILDPGHGGKDSGAQYGGLNEKDVNLAVASLLVTRLTMAGAVAFMTRDSDVFVPLPERPRLATAVCADAFVSIHCNGMPRPNEAHGTEAYYFTPQSKLLALILQRELVAGLGRSDNGVRHRRLAVLWRSQSPCALVELMYLDWDAENALLKLPETRAKAAEALFTALQEYFEGVKV
jgi:N-acetylmuramoyl-L-alanine amidase